MMTAGRDTANAEALRADIGAAYEHAMQVKGVYRRWRKIIHEMVDDRLRAADSQPVSMPKCQCAKCNSDGPGCAADSQPLKAADASFEPVGYIGWLNEDGTAMIFFGEDTADEWKKEGTFLYGTRWTQAEIDAAKKRADELFPEFREVTADGAQGDDVPNYEAAARDIERWIAAVAGDGSLAGNAAGACRTIISGLIPPPSDAVAPVASDLASGLNLVERLNDTKCPECGAPCTKQETFDCMDATNTTFYHYASPPHAAVNPAASDGAIGLDDHPMRDRFAEAIMGALMYGSNNANPAPAGHWLEQFWQTGNEIYKAQRTAATAAPRDVTDDRITGAQWKAGRDAFVKYADRYAAKQSSEPQYIIADIAPAEIYKAMTAALTTPPNAVKPGEGAGS